MDPPKTPSHKFDEFIKKRKDQIVTVLKGDFWMMRKHWWLKWFFWLVGIPIILTGTLVCLSLISYPIGFACTWTYMYFYDGDFTDTKGQPIDWNKIGNGDFKKATIVRDQNGHIIDRFFFEIRDPLKENEIPELLANAFVAAEDDNFWVHPGVDPTAIPRAALGNGLRRFGINWWANSGASGITQQTVRLAYSEEVPEFHKREHSWSRKWKEMHFAIQLEKRYTKKEILAAFLNYVYFGHGRYGVREASRYYFGHDNLGSLTPKQVARMASMNKGSKKYCPIFHEPPKPTISPSTPDDIKALIEKEYENKRDKEKLRISRARERNNWALYQLREEGYINNEQYHASLFDEKENLTELTDLKITPARNPAAGYITRMVKEKMFGIGFEDEDITQYGGFQIKTCTDIRIQNTLNDKMSRHLAELNNEIEDKSNPINGSAVIIDVETGCIVALSGGYNYRESPFNRTMALRSIGSGFKIFTLGKALEDGKGFDDPVDNRPFSRRGANGKIWSPQNFEEDNPVHFGIIPFKVAFIRSVNLPTLRQAMETGPERIVDFVHRLGVWGVYGIIKDPEGKIIFRMPGVEDTGDGIVPRLPTAIGASDVNLVEVANAIAQIFRGGAYLPPKLILEIKDAEGNVVFTPESYQPKQTIPEDTAQKIMILMRAVAEVGTAKISMRNKDENQQYGIKTGTSNNSENVFMGGGSPKYVMAMRFGHDKLKPIELPRYMKRRSQRSDLQPTGGWVVGFIFREIMDAIHASGPVVKFPPAVEEGTIELLANYPNKYK